MTCNHIWGKNGEPTAMLDVLGMVVTEINHQSAVRSGMDMAVGLIVMVVWWGGSANMAGVETGDLISEVDGKRVVTLRDLQFSLAVHDPRTSIGFLFRRVSTWRFLMLPFKEYLAGGIQHIYSSVETISHFNAEMNKLRMEK